VLFSLVIQRILALLVLCHFVSWCLPHFLQKVQWVLGKLTMIPGGLVAPKALSIFLRCK
jgi:hypothetical protein